MVNVYRLKHYWLLARVTEPLLYQHYKLHTQMVR